MIDNSTEYSLARLWDTWCLYRKGKKKTGELAEFEYDLLDNLAELAHNLQKGTWRHGPYRFFQVNDNKKRLVSVAGVRDKIVHRLVYEYLSHVYDKRFDFDVWSGRKNKGLLKAIRRAQFFAKQYKNMWVLKMDIKKCFDTIDQIRLFTVIQKSRLIKDDIKLLCKEIIFSYNKNTQKGLPIGNVTSHVFAHVYLHGIDVKIRSCKNILAYARYGDDMLCVIYSQEDGLEIQTLIERELSMIGLYVNTKSSYLRKISHGFDFLGCKIYVRGRKLVRRKLFLRRVSFKNFVSYINLFKKHDKKAHDILKWYENV